MLLAVFALSITVLLAMLTQTNNNNGNASLSLCVTCSRTHLLLVALGNIAAVVLDVTLAALPP